MRRYKWFIAFPALLASAASLSQERGHLGYSAEEILGMCQARAVGKTVPAAGIPIYDSYLSYSPVSNVRRLEGGYEVVVDGEFFNAPPAAVDAESLSPNEVVVGFRISRAYKGSVPNIISVRLNSDMLAFSGDKLSRFAKRMQVVEELGATIRPIWEASDRLLQSYEAGEISNQEFNMENQKLNTAYEESGSDLLSKLQKYFPPYLSHGDTFYSRGGAIKENEHYLVGIDPIGGSPDAFQLEEYASAVNVFWGGTEGRRDHRMGVAGAILSENVLWRIRPPQPSRL